MSHKLNILIAQVADMDRAVAFYRDVLGLPTGYVSPHWSEVKMGDLRIGLHPLFEGSTPDAQGKGWVFGFSTEDIKSLRARLVQAGAWVKEGYHDTPSGAVMDFRDPDGNSLQAIQLGVSARKLTVGS